MTTTTKSVLITQGQKSDWGQGVFCHVESLFQTSCPQGTEYKGDTVEVEVEVDEGRLKLSEPKLLPYVLQFLVREQPNGEEGFLPLDGCHIGSEFRYFLGYSPEGEDSVGWYITR